MADDKKISDYDEITSGIHDDMQLEVYDPNEGLAADQNKRIKFVTLEAIFGAEDKIFEGDTSVEVIDTGTGQVDFTVDGGLVARVTAAGLQFGGAGPFIDTFETALTDDDTHGPTSGAVVDALVADVKDIISEGDTSVEVIDAGTGQVLVTVDGNPIFDVLAAGMAFATGARVDTIETVLTDDDTHSPTSGAVVDALVADVKDIISEGNTSVEVIDAGTGQIDSTVDGSLKSTMNADGLQLKGDQTGAEAIGNVATTVAITFGTAHADASYQVLATVENIIDGGPLVLAAVITTKATTGFTATLSAATDSANYVLNWLVVRS